MNGLNLTGCTLAVAIVLAANGSTHAEEITAHAGSAAALPAKHTFPKIMRRRSPAAPASEPAVPASGTLGLNDKSAFTATAPAAPNATGSTAITPPLTFDYSGSSTTLSVSNGGSGKAVAAYIPDAKNTSSALYGQTAGSGAGLTGYNSGISGPAGKFGITNVASSQSAVYATTGGTGPAISGVIVKPDGSDSPAIYGASTNGEAYRGTGVEGFGGNLGVIGTTTVGTGVIGESDTGDGVEGVTSDGTNGTAGVAGQSENGYGVYGEDVGAGVGVYGTSTYGSAGYFLGNVIISGTLSVNGVNVSSDKNLKSGFLPIDGSNLLKRIDSLPITSWNFKSDAERRHVGPIAQDFHAAFGLDGQDDTHINLVDISGVSLAAIKELSRQMHVKDAQIASLNARLSRQERQTAAQTTSMQALVSALLLRVNTLEQHQVSNTQSPALQAMLDR